MPHIKKIGRSFFLRIPHDIVKELNISEEEFFTVEIKDGETLICKRSVPHGSVWRLVPCQASQ